MHDGEAGSSSPADGHVAASHGFPAAPSPRRRLAGATSADSSLDDRISSGEFTDAGSTKERLSRPVRKFFASDPYGPGENWEGGRASDEKKRG
jgi:hypothetical protein